MKELRKAVGGGDEWRRGGVWWETETVDGSGELGEVDGGKGVVIEEQYLIFIVMALFDFLMLSYNNILQLKIFLRPY